MRFLAVGWRLDHKLGRGAKMLTVLYSLLSFQPLRNLSKTSNASPLVLAFSPFSFAEYTVEELETYVIWFSLWVGLM